MNPDVAATDSEGPLPSKRGGWPAYAPVLVLVLLTAMLYGRGLTQSRGVAGDSFHHLLNGIFLHDAASDAAAAISDPLRFGKDYYRHYPAVNLGYYPPLFAMTEAATMAVVGVSNLAGQLTVFIHAIAMALFAYAWFRRRLDRRWAVAAAAVLISTPLLVFWGTDIMLEVPALAYMLGAMWGFEQALRSDRPTWSSAMLCGICTALAVLTKQHAILLLPVFVVSIGLTRRWRHLLSLRIITGVTIMVIGAGAVVAMTLRIGGAAVGHTLGHTSQHVADRFNVDQWLFYMKGMPEILTWPTLALATLGLVISLRRRVPYTSPLVVWVVLFYLMHSYFKGQNLRYGCLCLPPFVLLAVHGLKDLAPSRRWIGATVMALWTVATIVQGTLVRQPGVPAAYQQAADLLAEKAPPFAILTFFPDFPGRPVTCYRLAAEKQRRAGRRFDDFGHILRAGQVLGNWRERWSDLDAVNAELRAWNVKYLMTELPRPVNPFAGEDVVASAVDGIIAAGAFREIHRWPAHWEEKHMPHRTLILYERREPMTFDARATWPMKLARMGITLPSSKASTTP